MQLLVLWPLETNNFNSKHLNSIEPKLNLGFPLVLPVNTVFNSVASFVDLTDAIPTSPPSHCARPPYYTAHQQPSQQSCCLHKASLGSTFAMYIGPHSYSLKFLKCLPMVTTHIIGELAHAYLSDISYNGILSLP